MFKIRAHFICPGLFKEAQRESCVQGTLGTHVLLQEGSSETVEGWKRERRGASDWNLVGAGGEEQRLSITEKHLLCAGLPWGSVPVPVHTLTPRDWAFRSPAML